MARINKEDGSITKWLESQIEKSKKVMGKINLPDEMERTQPPQSPCGQCEKISENCANFPLPDNRMDLYRLFAQLPTERKGVNMWYCKSCLVSCFSRDGLYVIETFFLNGSTNRELCWIPEKVACRLCGVSWRWEALSIEEQIFSRLPTLTVFVEHHIWEKHCACCVETNKMSNGSPKHRQGNMISIRTEGVSMGRIPIKLVSE